MLVGVCKKNMGMPSRLYGYIDEASPGWASGNDPVQMERRKSNSWHIHRHNRMIMSTLPPADTWPPLDRHMFGWVPADAEVSNHYGLNIHFAASLKEVDWDLRTWLDKFEVLLRCLYWERVVLHFEAAYLGHHTFTWRPKEEWLSRVWKGHLELITEWDFESSMELKDLAQLRGV